MGNAKDKYYWVYDKEFEEYQVFLEDGAAFGDEWIAGFETQAEAEEYIEELNEEE